MKERPILFNAEMVRACLAGRMTQHRVPVIPPKSWPTNHKIMGVSKLPKGFWEIRDFEDSAFPPCEGVVMAIPSPFGALGDRLWVREKTRLWDVSNDTGKTQGGLPVKLRYEADGEESGLIVYPKRLAVLCVGYCVPNGCYREASRITLEVKRVWGHERLRDISEDDAIAEGIVDGGCGNCGNSSHPDPCGCDNPTPMFADSFFFLWNSIYGQGEYASKHNPPVWACEFAVVEGLK